MTSVAAGLTTPEGIERFDDLCYGENAKWNRLDIYRPRGRKENLPVIASVHGGGWVYGDKENQYYCMSLAEQGYAVVNFSYRLAPKFKFPAPLEDTKAVFHWMMRNAEPYGLDTTRAFGVGDSGGALCADSDCPNCGTYEIQIGNRKDLVANLMADFLSLRSASFQSASFLQSRS